MKKVLPSLLDKRDDPNMNKIILLLISPTISTEYRDSWVDLGSYSCVVITSYFRFKNSLTLSSLISRWKELPKKDSQIHPNFKVVLSLSCFSSTDRTISLKPFWNDMRLNPHTLYQQHTWPQTLSEYLPQSSSDLQLMYELVNSQGFILKKLAYSRCIRHILMIHSFFYQPIFHNLSKHLNSIL